jgi:RHS repeat-associated protein
MILVVLLLLSSAPVWAASPQLPPPPYAWGPDYYVPVTRTYTSITEAADAYVNGKKAHFPTAATCTYSLEPANDGQTVAWIIGTGTTIDGKDCGFAFGIAEEWPKWNEIYSVATGDYLSGPNLGSACNCDGGLGGASGNPVEVGDPINAAIGNKYEQEDDYVGASLAFRRFYNSAQSTPLADMGLNWRHSYDRQILIDSFSDGSQRATVLRPDGHQETFTRDAVTSAWTIDSSIADTLKDVVTNGQVSGYTLSVVAVHLQETYGADGLLQSITDESGRSTTLTYSTDQTPPGVAPKVGLLITVADAQGRRLQFTYDTSARLAQVILPDNGKLTYGYDANNTLVSVQYPDGGVKRYVYNEPALTNGENYPFALTGSVDELGGRYANTYYYNYSGDPHARVSNLNGGVGQVNITYNIDGWGTSQINYALGAVGYVQVAAVNGGRKIPATVRAYCGTSCGFGAATYKYDANGYSAGQKDFNNVDSSATVSPSGLTTAQVDAVGTPDQRTTNTVWDEQLRRPIKRSVTDAAGHVVKETAWAYNARGQAVAECEIDPVKSANYNCTASGIPPVGVRRTSYTYCDIADATQCPLVGLLLSIDGPRTDVSDVTQYRYYLTTDESGCANPGGVCHRLGDLYQIVDAAGHATTYLAYDKNGRVARTKSVDGLITDLTYSPRGWLTQYVARANADGTSSTSDAVTTTDYDLTGTVHKVTDPDGVALTYAYDGAHRLTDVTDNLGNRIHYTLDAAGNKVKEETSGAQGVLRRSVARAFNTLGELTSVTDGLNQVVFNARFADSYDASGRLVHSADGLGIERLIGYDALNRLSYTLTNYNGADASTRNANVSYAYDANDNLEGVTDPNNLSTTFDRDGLGNLIAQHSPDTGTTTYSYDAAGNRVVETDAKGTQRTYTYDRLNRLVAAQFPNSSQNITYQYDQTDTVTGCSGGHSVGRLTRILENGGATVYCYNVRGDVVSKRQVLAGHTDLTTYRYSKADRRTQIRYPDGGQVDYQFNNIGRVSGITITAPDGTRSAVTAIKHMPFGPTSSYTLGNGATLVRTYDANYALTDLTGAGVNLHFARDAMGNITALGTTPGASLALETYAYDALGRLTAVTDAGGTVLQAFSYNQAGDRLSKSGAGLSTGAYEYAPGTHHLTATGSAARVLDANGSITGSVLGGETFGYGYNDRGRISVVQRNGATVATQTYNALGERVMKALATESIRYNYDEVGRLTNEMHDGSTRDYVWLEDLPVAIIDTSAPNGVAASSLAFVASDEAGVPRTVTNSSQAVVWQWPFQTNVFGEAAPSSNGFTLNLRFPGQYADTESALTYNRYRYFEPSTGRYMRSDPSGLLGGLDTYSYAANSPLMHADPFGLDWLANSPVNPDHPPTIVCDGKGGITVFLGHRYTPDKLKCFGDCIIAHEQVHVQDAMWDSPTVCAGKDPNLLIYNPSSRTIDASEVRAYNVSIPCLERKLKEAKAGAGCPDGHCEGLIQEELDWQKYLLGYYQDKFNHDPN